MLEGDNYSNTVVILSGRGPMLNGYECLGQNVWHAGTRFASLQMLNSQTCVLITDEEDVRGYLSSDGHEIEWEDGDRWTRSKATEKEGKGETEGETEGHAEEKAEPMAAIETPEEAVLDVLLRRDAELFKRLRVDRCVNPRRLWPEIGWTPDGGQETPTPLIVAAILLQWPEVGGLKPCVV